MQKTGYRETRFSGAGAVPAVSLVMGIDRRVAWLDWMLATHCYPSHYGRSYGGGHFGIHQYYSLIARDLGLQTAPRISHVFLMNAPTCHKVLIVTDRAIHIAPNPEDKADICRLAISVGPETPKTAIVAAVETASSKLPTTVDAAVLSKTSERNQIAGGIPGRTLAFDKAISRQAAKIKAIHSVVAGDPDILPAPDQEAGNMIAEKYSLLANAESAGLVLGARVPIVRTRCSDAIRSRIASRAAASLVAHPQREHLLEVR